MPTHKDVALLHGSSEPALWSKTIGDLIHENDSRYGNSTALVVPWQSYHCSYADLAEQSCKVSIALLNHGLRHGDCVGVMAGNRFEYIHVFLGAARLGCPVLLLNNTYSPDELLNACNGSACKMVFVARTIGHISLSEHIERLCTNVGERRVHDRQQPAVICFDPASRHLHGQDCAVYYEDFLNSGALTIFPEHGIRKAEAMVTPDDLINLQFTSGTTGAPKAAMLTSSNLLNNARFVGQGIGIREGDILCCPPPLFHCFGLVLGVLMAFTHGIPVVLPSDTFNAERTIDSIHKEGATILHGVPTMFLAELEVVSRTGRKPATLRTCFGAGSAVTGSLVRELDDKMGVQEVIIGYGMTETSPISFMTVPSDSREKKLSSIGRLIPHVGAKVIGRDGTVLSRGQRGELCTTGFGLQKGYLNNPAKTAEDMRRDAEGVLWMHTGDEAFIDDEGYGHITGRIKDLIIRGGENIYPGEIEERLLEHPAISETSVVGIRDSKYGEVVGSFLRLNPSHGSPPTHEELRTWVLGKLARQKAPAHVFWVGGEAGCVIGEFPKTGSGKYQKPMLRELGNKIVGAAELRARL